MTLTLTHSASWAIPASDTTVIEVVPYRDKFAVAIVIDDTRHCDSLEGVSFECAKARAIWLASAFGAKSATPPTSHAELRRWIAEREIVRITEDAATK